MANLSPYSQKDLSRGVYSKINSFIAPRNSVQHAINFLFDDVYGAAKVRAGSTIIGSQLVAENNSVLGLHNFRSRSTSNHALLGAVNIAGDTTVSIFNVATGAALKTGLTANAVCRFETYLDECVFVNGTDASQAFTGTGSFGASSNLDTSSMPIGIDVKNFKDRLWVLNKQGILYGSSFSTSPSFDTISWTSNNKTIQIDPDSGAFAGIGIGLAKVSGLLLIFKERAIYSYNGSATQADYLYNIGCSSVRSIAEGFDSVFFFNPSGIFTTKGGEPVKVSRPVQVYIDGMSSSNYSSVAGYANEKYYWCSIGNVTIGLTTYQNVVLRYSISTQEWAVLSYASRLTAFSQYINGTAVTIAYGDNTARVLTLDSGTTDNGTAIEFELLSQRLDFGAPGYLKDVHDSMFIHTLDSSDMEISIRPDNKDFITIGHCLKDTEEVDINVPLLGHFFEIQIVGSTSGASPVIYGYELPSISSTGYVATN